MNINPQTSLAWSAVACAVLWGGGMVWWLGSFDPVAIIIFLLGGNALGGGKRRGMASKRFGEHAVDGIGPAAVMLHDLVGDMDHREPAGRE